MNENNPSTQSQPLPLTGDSSSQLHEQLDSSAADTLTDSNYPVSIDIDADSPVDTSIPADSPSRKKRWPWYLLGFVGVCFGLFVMLTFLWLSRFDRIISEKLDTAIWDIPAKVYARPLELYAGQNLSARALAVELDELGYRQNLEIEDSKETGSYNLIQRPADAEGIPTTRIEIHLREFDFADTSQPSQTIVVDIRNTTVTAVETASSEQGAGQGFRLDPLLIGTLHSPHHEDRETLKLGQLPEGFIATLLAVEDKRFYSHFGVSIRGTLRALLANLKTGRKAQGGSTLTQQLVKNLFLNPEKTYSRKLREIGMALVLEWRYEKDKILELFINEVFLAQQGNRAIHGFGLASRYFFDKPLAETTLAESALLIGMIKAPSAFNPERNPERARERRNTVLTILENDGIIEAERAELMRSLPVEVASGDTAASSFKHHTAYLDLVQRQLVRDYSETALQSDGLRIFTNFNPAVQAAAERSLQRFRTRFARSHPDKDPSFLQTAIIVSDRATGEVQALVGGIDSRPGTFNRALDARRPIGSLAKVAVYLSALESGGYTLGSILDDSRFELKLPNGDVWKPENFNRKVRGNVLLIDALAYSLNLPAARVAMDTGLENVVDTFHKLGIDSDIAALPSIALGTLELTPLEVNRMYQTIANDGFSQPQRAIRTVLDGEGQLSSQYAITMKQPFAPETLYLLQYALADVMLRGSGRSRLKQLQRDHFVAGKTGTTEGQRDSWFSGFAGDYQATVWIGNDDNIPTPLTGSSGALPIWTAMMREVSTRALNFGPRPGIEYVPIDPISGKRSSRSCSSVYLLPFIEGTAPDETVACAERKAGNRLQRWLQELVD